MSVKLNLFEPLLGVSKILQGLKNKNLQCGKFSGTFSLCFPNIYNALAMLRTKGNLFLLFFFVNQSRKLDLTHIWKKYLLHDFIEKKN